MELTREMAEKILSAKDYEEAKKQAAEIGYEMTEEEEAALKKSFTKELRDDELEQAAGGALNWGSIGRAETEESVVFEFGIGDRVQAYVGYICGRFIVKWGTIQERRIKRDVDYVPQYYVVFEEQSRPSRWCYQFEITY